MKLDQHTRTCSICGLSFIPNVVAGRYGGQKLCGSLLCQKRYKAAHYQEHKAYYAEYQRENRTRPYRNGDVSTRTKAVKGWTRCHWCALPFALLPGVLCCPRCLTAYEAEKAAQAVLRASSGYLDIVSANAKRAGKSPAEEVERALGNNKFIFPDKGALRDVNKKLDTFNRKRAGSTWIHTNK